MEQISVKLSASELFSRLGEQDKVLFVIYDCSGINRRQIAEVLGGVIAVASVASVASAASVASVASVAPRNIDIYAESEQAQQRNEGNESNDSNKAVGGSFLTGLSLIEHKLRTTIPRLLEKQLIIENKSVIPYVYSIAQLGRSYVEKKYADYQAELDAVLKARESQDRIMRAIDTFKDYFTHRVQLGGIQNSPPFVMVDVCDLSQYDLWLTEQLIDDPEELRRTAQLAIEGLYPEIKDCYILLKNIPKSHHRTITSMRAADIGRIRCVDVEVSKRSQSSLTVSSSLYECPSCGNRSTILQIDNRIREPSLCGCGRKGKFKLVKNEMVDSLRLIVSDPYEALLNNEQPEDVNVYFKGDVFHFSQIKEGDYVRLVGVMKSLPSYNRDGSKGIDTEKLFEVYGIEPLRADYSKVQITAEDEKGFELIRQDPIRYVKDFLFYDLDNVEDEIHACIISLFSETNTLLIGDPGSGKSVIAQRCANACIRGRFASTINASASGIIGTITKNPFINKYSIDGGVLRPMHPNGLVVVDEINRDEEQKIQRVLLGVMTNQRLNIHKANTRLDTPCKVSIWSTANPISESYDEYKPIFKNFGILPPFWDRVDLIIFFNNSLDAHNIAKIAELLSNHNKDFQPDKNKMLLFKKYELKAKELSVELDNDAYKKLSALMADFSDKIDKGKSSYRRLGTMKQLLQGICRMFHRTKPIDSDYQLMTDLIIKLSIGRQQFEAKHSPKDFA